jgi:hypothetical protein
MDKDTINEVLTRDRRTLVAELRQAEQALDAQSCGEVASALCDDLIRECNVLTGALEMYDGTQELDLVGHTLTGNLTFSRGDKGRDDPQAFVPSPFD